LRIKHNADERHPTACASAAASAARDDLQKGTISRAKRSCCMRVLGGFAERLNRRERARRT